MNIELKRFLCQSPIRSTLMDTINITLKVLHVQSMLVKPAAGFSDPMAISKTGS
jgi:hypothetical protein